MLASSPKVPQFRSPLTLRILCGSVLATTVAASASSIPAAAGPSSGSDGVTAVRSARDETGVAATGKHPRRGAAKTQADALPGTRDLAVWPFSSSSIWNMPIGSSARYRALNMSAPGVGYAVDEAFVTLSRSAPLVPVVERSYWWPWRDGSTVTGTITAESVRLPFSYTIAAPPSRSYPNRPMAAINSKGKIREFQYVVRPSSGSPLSIFEGLRAEYSLDGDGLAPTGQVGSHGGSGMLGLGGALRAGELGSSQPIRHALALTMNMRKWGAKRGNGINNGYRWPAIAADGYFSAATGYGSLGTGRGIGMGSLVAIPRSVNLGALGFETLQGAKLAWTHQNYGAYVVDDSYDPGDFDVHRLNVESGVLTEFPAIDTGYTTNTPFGRDMNKIFTRLAAVENNSPSTIGGGGAPLQPLAPVGR